MQVTVESDMSGKRLVKVNKYHLAGHLRGEQCTIITYLCAKHYSYHCNEC